MGVVQKSSPFWYLLPIFLGFVGAIISYLILKNTDQQRAKRCIVIGIIFSIPFASWIGLQINFGTQNPFFVVSNNGMAPALEVYDVIVAQGSIPFEDIKIGDIIVFEGTSPEFRVIVHRVVAIIDEDPLTLRTKGDAGPALLSVTEDEYIGKIVNVFPQIGYITRILSPPINYIIMIIFVVVVMLKLGIGHGNYRKSLSSKIIPPTDDTQSKSLNSKINPHSQDTQFWVCPNCGHDTHMKEGREYCPSCKFYLSI